MPTTCMLKVVNHTVRTRKHDFKLTINSHSKSAHNSHVKRNKMKQMKIIPISIKHFGILMVLITSLFVLVLYFVFKNFREGAADIVY